MNNINRFPEILPNQEAQIHQQATDYAKTILEAAFSRYSTVKGVKYLYLQGADKYERFYRMHGKKKLQIVNRFEDVEYEIFMCCWYYGNFYHLNTLKLSILSSAEAKIIFGADLPVYSSNTKAIQAKYLQLQQTKEFINSRITLV